MSFEPVAIVAQACTLPEAHSPQELWANVAAKRNCLSRAPEGRWGIGREVALGTVDRSEDRTWSDVGGYVRGFADRFDASGFALPADEVRALDPLFQLVLHGARESLRAAGHEGTSSRAGLVLGNLSFPSAGMSRYAESVWLEAQGPSYAGGHARLARPHPRNRFNSGLPAHLAARALGLGGGAFALDAACASSLYAIKLACDRLHDRSADLMVAGAVNQADDLFIHIGFCALSALSKTGQSRPFHQGADGLVPAEGAGFVVLQRLEDAIAAGRKVLGVIRGVGLSNDGRGRGLLAPSEEGQERALRLAYAEAGLSPGDVGLIECHATGTPVGDATELRSMARVFAGCDGLPIGSLKSNLGHLITAAGVAGLIKVLGALEHGRRPATLHADVPNEALRGTPFRLLHDEEAWTGPRRAGISAFGFGGNNAHLIVEAFDGTARHPARARVLLPAPPIAIVGVGARAGDGESARDLAKVLLSGLSEKEKKAPRATVSVAQSGLRFPPKDLSQTLAQQTLLLEAAREAAAGIVLPRERTAVLAGMGCDPEVARYGARWRLGTWAARWSEATGISIDTAWLEGARTAFHTPLQSAGVVGTMPNIPANRLNSQLDLAGPAFTVSAEEASGLVALELAARALRAGEIDAALIGAVDLSHELVHTTALSELGLGRAPGDAAVALVLKRLADAQRDGDPVYAVLGGDEAAPGTLQLGGAAGPGSVDLERSFGNAHAAQGLLHVAAAALALRHGAQLRAGAAATPWFGARSAEVAVPVLEAPVATARLSSGAAPAAWVAEAPARLHIFSGADREGALAALAAGRESSAVDAGPARLVLVATDHELAARAEQARRWLASGGPPPQGVAFRAAPLVGELAFVFTGAAAAYPGMGRELALAFPAQAAALAARNSELLSSTNWLYGAGPGTPAHPLDQLWGTAFVCQLHAELSRRLLGLTPQATIGYSSGESNALFAMGAWNDLGEMIRESRAGTTFTSDLVGAFDAPRRAWARLGEHAASSSGAWTNYSVAAPAAQVLAALANEPLAHLTIVNAPGDCVIGGEAAACARVIEKLGRERALPLGYDMAAHCPEVEQVREAWWKLHRRAVANVPGVRFYTNANNTWYRPTPEAAADAITGQALHTLDFPKTIEQAWNDGVRIFVEHGPRGLCSGWIKTILGDREHLAVPLDVAGRSDVGQVLHAAAWLVAAGVPVDHRALERLLAAAVPAARPPGPRLELPAHSPVPRLPPFETRMQVMTPAPRLVPVLEQPEAAVQERNTAPAVAPRHAPHAVHAPARFEAPSPLPQLEARALAPVAHVGSQATAPAPTALDGVLARFSAHQAQLSAVHRDFLAQQSAVHQQFLALRASTEAALLQAYGAVASGQESLGAHADPLALPAGASRSALAAPAIAQPASLAAPLLAQPAPQAAPAAPRAVALASSAAAPAFAPPPAARLPAAAAPVPEVLPGPKFGRAQLEILAGGKISSVFGPGFASQDGFARQVRMPEPPLLLADRVTGIDAEPGSMRTGTLWTETDVRQDSWYLTSEGRMPAGVMIEAGQADLLLISWLGIDAQNRGERVYRLLGCELTYHGGLPIPGDTLAYAIHVDGHAAQGDVRLFFFHYDCKVRGQVRLSVRHGQAGFFTDQELADSAGVLWRPEDESGGSGPLDPPAIACSKQRFSQGELRAFADGRASDCFGPGWEETRTHVRTPRITGGRMQFLDEVTRFDPRGGPWGRGYLKAETPVTPGDWFFAGHFKNDPCMPGTLMFEGCLQAMSVYLAALGFTAGRDGWRFEPVPDRKYPMRCRGQVTPQSKHLVYEVFVSEVIGGPQPTLVADLLCTVDGRKAFHAKGVGLRLVPDWPLDQWKLLGPAATQPTGEAVPLPVLAGLQGHREPKPVATVEGFAFDYHSLLACAWGPPSAAFGPFYARFDGARRAARLPGPPYHFMSRITALDGPIGGMKTGTTVEVEYDLPGEQWYFEQNGARTMPFCVLMEAALQPCGWLASYVGSALTQDVDLLFRNLDGTGTQFVDLLPGSGTLKTKVKLTSISQSAGMIIESFAVECFVGEQRVYQMTTVFGFFPKESFENQVGLPVSDAERARIQAPSGYAVDLNARPERYCAGTLRLAGPMLLMLDRITGYWPEGGKAGLGYLRAEKDVSVDEWFFKAHFFQDPVQPGSLGIEALCQLLQFFMLEKGLGAGIANPRFEPLMLGKPITWKYRGQVVPKNKVITSEVQIVEVGEDAQGRFAIAEGWLWVDGKRIYQAKNLGMRIVAGPPPEQPKLAPSPGPAVSQEERLDPATDTWLADHCPTWTLPALPMMSMVDRLAGAAQAQAGRPVTSLENVQVHRWLPFSGERVRLKTEVTGQGDERAVALLAWREARDPKLSRFEPVASGKARFAALGAAPAAFAPLGELVTEPDPYASGALFHGPAFQYLTSLRMGASGSSATLDAGRGTVPRGALHQGLLDAATHAIPHDALSRWSTDISADSVGYPIRIASLQLFAPLPAEGEVRLETRFSGFDGDTRYPTFEVQLITGDRVLLALRLVEVLLPRGPIGAAPREARRAFLRDARFVPGVALSDFDGTTTRLTEQELRESDWLPGNLARIYRVPQGEQGDLLAAVAQREHAARRAFVHPSAISLEPGGARADVRPLRLHGLTLLRSAGAIAVSDDGKARQDLAQVRAWWRERIGVGPWPVEDLYYGLIERFVDDVVLVDPAAFARVRGRSCLYLGNHQVGVESLLFSVLASALSATPTVTLAKAEHRTSWLGTLIAHNFAWPGVVDPQVIRFFDREDKESLLQIVGELGQEMRRAGKSAMVHVEGTRSLTCREPVVKMSSAFIDLALAVGAPIVPVRLSGGLPVAPLDDRLEFPFGFGRQDYWIGKPILPEELSALPFKERKQVVLAAINGLGPGLATEAPLPGDPQFAVSVAAWISATGAAPEDAVLFGTLAEVKNPGPEVRALLDAARTGRLQVGPDPRGQWLGRLAQRLFGPRGPAVLGVIPLAL